MILLLVVFGALIAAGIPVLLAGSAVTGTISLLAIASRWLPVGSGTAEVVLILGMAVGVDYSLFYLRREREERAAGRSAAEAVQVAAATSGRAIVISGLTVLISLAGLLLSGIDLFTGMAVGTMIVVGVAVAGSVTVLPALLALLGTGRTAAGSRSCAAAPQRGRRGCGRRWSAGSCAIRWPGAGPRPSRCWRSPRPHSGMRIGNPVIDLPGSLPVVQTLDRISAGVSRPAGAGRSGGDRPGPDRPGVQRAVAALEHRASASGPVRRPGHRDRGSGGPRADHRCAAGRQRVGPGLRQRAGHVAQPGPAGNARQSRPASASR